MVVSALTNLGGCDNQRTQEETDDLNQLGLIRSFRGASSVKEAVSLVNAVVGPGGPSVTYGPVPQGDLLSVPLYLVQGEELGPLDICFVPAGCNCIVVNADLLVEFDSIFSMSCDACDRVTRSNILAVLLLHELGHIADDSPGSYVSAGPFTLQDINMGRKRVEHPELAADLFAGRLIREATLERRNRDRFFVGLDLLDCISTGASNFFWTRQQYDSEALEAVAAAIESVVEDSDPDQLGKKAATLPSNTKHLYWDLGYTHPNLELRYLVLLDAILQSESTQEALSGYFELRDEAETVAPGNIWIMPD